MTSKNVSFIASISTCMQNPRRNRQDDRRSEHDVIVRLRGHDVDETEEQNALLPAEPSLALHRSFP